MTYLNAAFILARIALVAALLPLAIGWRTPLMTTWRPIALVALLAVPLIIVAIDIWTLRRMWSRSTLLRLLSGVSLVLAICTFGVTATIELRFQHMRRAVLAADPQLLEKLGAHVVVGYRKPSELHALLERRAIAGVFLSALNVERKTPDEIRDTIAGLQDIRRAQNLAPLWIATDQEGGPVSRMSPPLARMPPLAEIVAIHRDPAERRLAVRQYAARQGRELASLGVNLNFAPVVDLNHGVVNPEDKTSRISTRAISNDPAVVTDGGRRLLRDADDDRRALHAEAFPRSRPRLRGHAQAHRRPWSAGAGTGGHRLASVSAFEGEQLRLHDARPRAPDRHRRGAACVILACGRQRPAARHVGSSRHPDHRRFQHGRSNAQPRGRRPAVRLRRSTPAST